MTVINSEYAKSVELNGRMKDGGVVKVKLLPGLNNVSQEQMVMLRDNDAFEMHCADQKMSVVGSEENEEPQNIEDIDITSMSVAKAGLVIGSAATIELLDKFEQQEKDGDGRKGVLGTIAKQRVIVQDILDIQAKANRAQEQE